MARPGRLVNCSLVFLLVIRCTRAPGQAGSRASQARLARLLRAPGIITASASAVVYVPYQNRSSPARGYLQRTLRVALVCVRVLWAFRERAPSLPPGWYRRSAVRSTRTFSRNTQPGNAVNTAARNRSESRNKPERTLLILRCDVPGGSLHKRTMGAPGSARLASAS